MNAYKVGIDGLSDGSCPQDSVIPGKGARASKSISAFFKGQVRRSFIIIAVGWLFLFSSCASVYTLGRIYSFDGRTSPYVYPATTLDLQLIYMNSTYGNYTFIPFNIIDLPFSLVTDTFFLPLDLACIGGYWLYEKSVPDVAIMDFNPGPDMVLPFERNRIVYKVKYMSPHCCPK